MLNTQGSRTVTVGQARDGPVLLTGTFDEVPDACQTMPPKCGTRSQVGSNTHDLYAGRLFAQHFLGVRKQKSWQK